MTLKNIDFSMLNGECGLEFGEFASLNGNAGALGQCSYGATCGGGGGKCSYGASCGGGGGKCSYGATCGGS